MDAAYSFVNKYAGLWGEGAMRAYILYSFGVYFIINCSFSMHRHLFQQNNIYLYKTLKVF